VRFPVWLKGVLIFLLLIGMTFRFVNLKHKVYWHDEVYTSMRAAGYTRNEIDQALFQNQVIPAGDLQQYQRLKPNSTPMDTVRSLAVEDPQHPPLYFLLARFWMQGLGSSLVASRSLPAILSLLALPAMYALAWELFGCHATALLATTFLALSPFDVLFAQTARQYSLLTVLVLVSSYALLYALRSDSQQRPGSRRRSPWSSYPWLAWGWYGLAVAIGLYTHPFFALTIAGHGVYLVGAIWLQYRSRVALIQRIMPFGLALAIAGILYSPWLGVLWFNQQRALATTDWTQVFPGFDYLVKLWTLSFTSLFLDLDFGFNNSLTFLLRLPILMLLGIALYSLIRRTPVTTWLFVVTMIGVPFLLLAVPDVVMGGKRSAVSRYLISCYPGIQLAIANFLSQRLVCRPVYTNRTLPRSWQLAPLEILRRWGWRSVLGILILASLTSLTVSAASNSWWNKDLSYFNDRVADRINRQPTPIVLSDIGDDFTNTGDLISLSYRLRPEIPLLLIRQPDWVRTPEFSRQIAGKTAIAFRPSQPLWQTLEQTHGPLKKLMLEERLWQVPG